MCWYTGTAFAHTAAFRSEGASRRVFVAGAAADGTTEVREVRGNYVLAGLGLAIDDLPEASDVQLAAHGKRGKDLVDRTPPSSRTLVDAAVAISQLHSFCFVLPQCFARGAATTVSLWVWLWPADGTRDISGDGRAVFQVMAAESDPAHTGDAAPSAGGNSGHAGQTGHQSGHADGQAGDVDFDFSPGVYVHSTRAPGRFLLCWRRGQCTSSATAASTRRWTHLALVKDAEDRTRLFVDGEPDPDAAFGFGGGDKGGSGSGGNSGDGGGHSGGGGGGEGTGGGEGGPFARRPPLLDGFESWPRNLLLGGRPGDGSSGAAVTSALGLVQVSERQARRVVRLRLLLHESRRVRGLRVHREEETTSHTPAVWLCMDPLQGLRVHRGRALTGGEVRTAYRNSRSGEAGERGGGGEAAGAGAGAGAGEGAGEGEGGGPAEGRAAHGNWLWRIAEAAAAETAPPPPTTATTAAAATSASEDLADDTAEPEPEPPLHLHGAEPTGVTRLFDLGASFGRGNWSCVLQALQALQAAGGASATGASTRGRLGGLTRLDGIHALSEHRGMGR
jgi:hypothetical protein